MIKNKHILSGEKLPAERELADMFGVGRSSVREALRVLQAIGVLERRQGTGTYITDGAVQSLRRAENWNRKYSFLELAEARRMIEAQTVELSAKNADKKDIQIIKAAFEKHAKMLRLALSAEASILDYDFHRAVAQSTHNCFLLEMFDILRENLVSSNYVFLTKDKLINAIAYHKQILDAIKNHDPQTAKKAMIEHLLQVEKDIIQGCEN
jgi:GntR family transcriptional repressor for pyruvate dehydrogenase complex